MEQIYMIEIFIDKVTIFTSLEDDSSTADKNLTMKVNFGPKAMFIIKEGQLANQDRPEDIVQCDDEGRRQWTRSIRVGKSYMFPSFPDTILMILNKFPLEIEVWNDDENEVEIFVGLATMQWDTDFYPMLKESSDPTVHHEPLAIKQTVRLFAECCCGQVGTITFILRVSVMGDSIITEFQELPNEENAFVFRTNRAPSMFHCKRIEGDDPNFIMVGSLFETTTLEDPEVGNEDQKIEICTELQSCGILDEADYSCEHPPTKTKSTKKVYSIENVRMGDIIGPCGNANCELAHKVKNYIRALESYRQETGGNVPEKDDPSRKICGACSCIDSRYHRDTCPTKVQEKAICQTCGGHTKVGETCEDKKQQEADTGFSQNQSQTTVQVAYVFNVKNGPNVKESKYGRKFIAENLDMTMSNIGLQESFSKPSMSSFYNTETQYKVFNRHSSPNVKVSVNTRKAATRNLDSNINFTYNTTVEHRNTTFGIEVKEPAKENDCSCNPHKKTPPCKTFDCDCISEIINITARKYHKPYCPLYKHKPSCDVTMSLEEESSENLEEVEDKVEPLPYGLPPIRLGPCPILGRPCSVPDGFARMYKTAVQSPLPPSHSEAGKVCCSKEYWRIKKALKKYLKKDKEDDYKCLNRFNVDTERRCCDKEQALLELMGRGCCGAHKLSIQDKYEEK